jgi:hypothetical protein
VTAPWLKVKDEKGERRNLLRIMSTSKEASGLILPFTKSEDFDQVFPPRFETICDLVQDL